MLPPSLQSLFSPLDPDSSSTGNTSNPRGRWSALAKPALGMILAAGALTAGQAQAVVVTVNSQDWDVTTFTGTYNANTSKFALPSSGGVMPWWGSPDLAYSFASAISNSLGYPNFDFMGPFFGAYEYFDPVSGVNFVDSYVYFDDSADTLLQSFTTTYEWVYAQATQVSSPPAADVPGPLPALGAAAAFGFSRKLRTRIKRSTKIDSGTDCL